MKKLILFAVVLSAFVWATVGMSANDGFYVANGITISTDTTWTTPPNIRDFTIVTSMQGAADMTITLTFYGHITDLHTATTTTFSNTVKLGTGGNLAYFNTIRYRYIAPVDSIKVVRSVSVGTAVSIIPDFKP